MMDFGVWHIWYKNLKARRIREIETLKESQCHNLLVHHKHDCGNINNKQHAGSMLTVCGRSN